MNDGPPVLLKSNYCYASREVGVYEKFTYVEQKSGNFNVAPADNIVAPVYAYTYASGSDCGKHSLANVASYTALPAQTKCIIYEGISFKYF